jgi:hypothetical protein
MAICNSTQFDIDMLVAGDLAGMTPQPSGAGS